MEPGRKSAGKANGYGLFDGYSAFGVHANEKRRGILQGRVTSGALSCGGRQFGPKTWLVPFTLTIPHDPRQGRDRQEAPTRGLRISIVVVSFTKDTDTQNGGGNGARGRAS